MEVRVAYWWGSVILLGCYAALFRSSARQVHRRHVPGLRDTGRLRPASSSDLATAFAKCGFVDPPIVLDGSNANESDMARLADAITSYMQSMRASLQCLDVTEKDLKDGLSESQRSTISTIYNNGIDQMDFVAKEYNKQLRILRLSDRTYTPLDVPF